MTKTLLKLQLMRMDEGEIRISLAQLSEFSHIQSFTFKDRAFGLDWKKLRDGDSISFNGNEKCLGRVEWGEEHDFTVRRRKEGWKVYTDDISTWVTL